MRKERAMNRSEAIKILKEANVIDLVSGDTKGRQAVDLAIEALQKVSVYEQVKWERDQALETLDEHGIGLGQIAGKLKNPCDSLLTDDSEACKEQKSKLESEQMREYIPKDEVLDIIKSMPMDMVEEYVYELDGIWLVDDEEKIQLSVEPPVCEDAISRNWLLAYCKAKADHYRKRIEIIEEQGEAISYDPKEQLESFRTEVAIYESFAKEVMDAPPVEPERTKGHYIKGKNGEWYCSNCKRIDDKYSVAKFCWYCGVKMKG